MKKTKHTIEVTKWTDSCPHCGDKIEGRSENQCAWNVSVHILGKHKDLLNKKGGKSK